LPYRLATPQKPDRRPLKGPVRRGLRTETTGARADARIVPSLPGGVNAAPQCTACRPKYQSFTTMVRRISALRARIR